MKINHKSLTLQTLLFSVLMIAGGLLSLYGELILGAICFSLSPIFSSTNISWKDMSRSNKIIISASTAFGIFALMVSIFLDVKKL